MFGISSLGKRATFQLIAIVAVALGVFYVVYYDTVNTADVTLTDDQNGQNSTSTIENSPLEENNVQEPIGEAILAPDISKPDLDRLMIFYVELPSEAQDIYRKQIKDVTDILKIDSGLFNSWVELGGLWKQIGDYEAAREIWEYAGVLAPENNVSFFNLGDLYHYYLKDYTKAEKNFLIAKDNNPLYTPVYRALFDLYTLSYKQNTSVAVDVLLEGLASNPNNLDLTILLAGYYKGKGDTANARIYYEKALTEAERLGNMAMVELIKEELSAL